MVNDAANIERAARKFLKTGNSAGFEPGDLAEECNRLVRAETQRSIRKAIELGRAFVKQARRREGVPLQLALRSVGWALHMGGKYRKAEKAYLEARSLSKQDYVVRGRIDRILVDVYMYLGDYEQARKRALSSIRTFQRHGAHEDEAKTRVNYANLFHRQDRHREASREYRRAAVYFETYGGDLALSLCYYNEANTMVQLIEFERAEQLYSQAEKKFATLGYDLYVNECQYGKAWLLMLQGSYHVALEKLAACEKNYHDASQPKGEMLCQLDRAEAFLGLNLYCDARRTARSAEKRARKLGVRYESGKAAFYGGLAAVALGRGREAQEALIRAEVDFEAVKNPAFVSAVRLSLAQEAGSGKVEAATLMRIRRQFSRTQLPLWEAVCDLQLQSQYPDDGRVARRLAGNSAVRTVPHLYSHWQTHLGDMAAARGKLKRAAGHWARAAEMLDAVRAKLPPVEMRSGFMKRQSDPYLKLIRNEIKVDPARAAIWSERYKTTGVWTAGGRDFSDNAVRSRVEDSLAELAERVTALSGRISADRGKRGTTRTQSDLALRKLQLRVQSGLAAIEQLNEEMDDRFEQLLHDLQSVSRRLPVVQFHYNRNDLIAFVHCRGETKSHRYVDGRSRVNEFMGCWSILLSRSLLATDRQRTLDIGEERRLFSDIGSWLWKPLEVASEADRVLILPEGKLSNLPWMAVIDDGLPLASRHSLLLSPSLRHHIYARDRRIRSDRIDVFVGRQDGLMSGGKEYAALTECGDHEVVLHTPCGRNDWPSEASAWIWHYTGHAHFRCDNPFYSSLALEDGPLFAADFRVKNNRVGLVTLAACRTGNQSVLPGEESTGLVRSLLEMGARNVVGSHWNVSDRSTTVWMNNFYEQVLADRPIDEAVNHAGLCVRESFPSAYDWAAFSVFGAG